MVVLWPRQEVLQFGILAFGRSDRLPEFSYSWTNLKKFISRAKSKGLGCYPRLNYSTWLSIAVGRLRLTEEQAWLFFETFDAISDVDKERRKHVSQSLLRCKSEEEKGQVRADMSVDFLQFVIYLGIHLGDKPSLLLSPTDTWKTKWPLVSEKSKAQGGDAHQMTVLTNCLPKLVDMLSEPGGEGEVSYESVKALGILIGGMDNDDLIRPLEELASLQAEIKESGYSKLTMMFKSTYLLHWLQFYLDKNPYGTSAMMGGERDKKCPAFRSTKRGKVMSNTSLSPEGSHKLMFFHLSSQTVCKGPGTANGSSVEIQRCRNSRIYILAPLKFVFIEKCSNCTIVLGPVERMLSLDSCDGVSVTAICRKLHIVKTQTSSLYIHTPTSPVLFGGSSDLLFAPYNSHYPQLEDHLEDSMLDVKATNQWDNPIVTVKDPEDSIWSRVLPKDYEVLDVPFDLGSGSTHENPVTLPKDYRDELQARDRRLKAWSETVAKANLTTQQVDSLQEIVQEKFREWLEETGRDKEVADLQKSQTFSNSL
jgi:TBCC domain-containing protein 1